jgi:hypothetical protein
MEHFFLSEWEHFLLKRISFDALRNCLEAVFAVGISISGENQITEDFAHEP